jgi:hypothetical protein
MVMKLEDDEPVDDEPVDDDPVDDEPVEELPVEPVAPVEEASESSDVELDPPPDTVSPTWSFTAVTVPAIGAVRVVSLAVCWSVVTVC